MDPLTLALLGGAQVASGFMGAKASGKAAQAQSQAAMMSSVIQAQQADAARQQQERYFGAAQGGYAPYQRFGEESTNRLATLMGLRPGADSGSLMEQPTMAQLQMDPSYQFQFDQGMKALKQQMAAGGMSASGTALKGATTFGQNLASTNYGNAYNRFMQNRQNQINMLQGGVSTGFGAAQGIGNAAVGTGTNIGNTLLSSGQSMGQGLENAGQAAASGYMGRSTALSSALNAVPQNYMMASIIDRFAPSQAAAFNKNAGMNYGPQLSDVSGGNWFSNLFGGR